MFYYEDDSQFQQRNHFYVDSYGYRPIKKPSKISPEKLHLNNEMRLLWEQHVFWTRLLIVSIVEGLKDEDATTRRLLQNPNDIAKVFGRYHGGEVAKKIAELLREHLLIAAQLVKALKNNHHAAAKELDRRWYINADEIATGLNAINPFYGKEMMRRMMYQHLDLTKQEVAARLGGNYALEIAEFDKVENQALEMADHLSKGIMKRFPYKF